MGPHHDNLNFIAANGNLIDYHGPPVLCQTYLSFAWANAIFGWLWNLILLLPHMTPSRFLMHLNFFGLSDLQGLVYSELGLSPTSWAITSFIYHGGQGPSSSSVKWPLVIFKLKKMFDAYFPCFQHSQCIAYKSPNNFYEMLGKTKRTNFVKLQHLSTVISANYQVPKCLGPMASQTGIKVNKGITKGLLTHV